MGLSGTLCRTPRAPSTENVRFAARMREKGCEATVRDARGKTHLSIELEIGLGGDVPTAEILKFFDQQMRKPKNEI